MFPCIVIFFFLSHFLTHKWIYAECSFCSNTSYIWLLVTYFYPTYILELEICVCVCVQHV